MGAAVTSASSQDATSVIIFYSYSGGVGRSGTVANLAMILANAGKRVLVVDLDLESPSQYRYLRSFLPQGGHDGAKIAAPLRLECSFHEPTGCVDFAGPLVDHVPDRGAYSVQPADLRGREYDYVLIDSEAGAAGFADDLNIQLADVLVVGYNLFGQSITGAVQQARAVQNRGRAPRRILPVPMKVDTHTGGLAERQRMNARRSFGWLLADRDSDAQAEYWRNVEIPYVSDYSFDESLVGLDTPSEQRDTLLEAYLRLAREITGEPLTALTVGARFPEDTVRRYQASRPLWLDRHHDITVFYCAPDRSWAEWIVAELENSGLSACRKRVDRTADSAAVESVTPDSVVLVLSGAAAGSAGFAAVVDDLTGEPTRSTATVVGVEVDRAPLPDHFQRLPRFRLNGTDETSARTQLLAYFWSTAVPAAAAASDDAPRFPRRDVPLDNWNLPLRNSGFVGRDELIERVRDQLTGELGHGRPCAIVGPAGIGKSLIALEYAHRFASQYDMVWVIAADSVQSVQRGLAQLAGPVGAPRRGNAPTSVLDYLGQRFEGRWLLIYDGADDFSAIDNALPSPGRGHVLLTSRRVDLDSAVEVGVEILDRTETLALIGALVPDIDPADAEQLAQRLDDQPLSVELAATWVRQVARNLQTAGLVARDAVREAVAEFTEQLEQRLRTEAAGSAAPDLLTQLVRLLVGQLRHDDWGAAAYRLLETLSCLSPVGLARRIVESPACVADLRVVEPELSDPILLHNVLRKLVEYGFLPSDQPVLDVVRVHRRIMELVRASMSVVDLAVRQGAVVEILAACAPLGVDENTGSDAAAYQDLQPHVECIDPAQAKTDLVRYWLVNQVRYLWRTNEPSAWTAALRLGERLETAWREAPDQTVVEPFLLLLAFQLANVHRSRGDFQRAHDLDESVLARQRLLHGIKHLRTLMTARGYAADLRQIGRFEDALLEENSTWLAFRELLGDEHTLTGVALNNLIVSHLLMGEAQQALDLSRDMLSRSRAFARQRPDFTARALGHVGSCLRELGAYSRSRDRLLEARDEWARLEGGTGLSAPSIVMLQTTANLAATLRRLDEVEPGLAQQLYADALNHYGARHFATLICALGLSAQSHHDGDHIRAVELARECLDGLRVVYDGGEHPYVGVCATNLGRYAAYAQQWELARTQGLHGLTCLEEALGREHPWTAVAALAHSETLAALRRPAEALERGRPALTVLKSHLRANHPVVLYAEWSLARIDRLDERYPDTAWDAVGPCRHHLEIDLPIFI